MDNRNLDQRDTGYVLWLLLALLSLLVSVSLCGLLLFVGRAPLESYVATQVADNAASARSTQAPESTPTERPSEIPPTSTPTPDVPILQRIPWHSCLPNRDFEQVDFVEVIDPLTIRVLRNGSFEDLRYLGLDFPPSNRDSLKRVNLSLVAGKQLFIIRDAPHSFESGNLLRYVLTQDHFVNLELVQRGLALVSEDKSEMACLETLLEFQTLAKEQRLGYWSFAPTSTPTPNQATLQAAILTRSAPTATPTPTATPMPLEDLLTANECLNLGEYSVGSFDGVIDGVIAKVRIDGIPQIVRLIGVQTPDELHFSYTNNVSNYLLRQEPLYFVSDDLFPDDSLVLLRYVISESHFVNVELLARGLAILSDDNLDIDCYGLFTETQERAKIEPLGYWRSYSELSVPSIVPISDAARELQFSFLGKGQDFVELWNPTDRWVVLANWSIASHSSDKLCKLRGSIGPGETRRFWANHNNDDTSFDCELGEIDFWANDQLDVAYLISPFPQPEIIARITR